MQPTLTRRQPWLWTVPSLFLGVMASSCDPGPAPSAAPAGQLSQAISAAAAPGSAATPAAAPEAPSAVTESFEYIVVGSGAGGGPLAANLARKGHSVLLLEAGEDVSSR